MFKIRFYILVVVVLLSSAQRVHALSFTKVELSDDTGFSSTVVQGDINEDGYEDFYVAVNGQNRLWINDGQGGFTLTTIAGDTQNSTGAVLTDLVGDHHLDIYVTNYGASAQNRLWEGDGSGGFTSRDIASDTGFHYGVSSGDYNQDGLEDLYVSAAFGSEQNYILFNNGDTTFTRLTLVGDLGNSYGATTGDSNGDGHLDIYVPNFGGQNRLWLGDGSGGFSAADIPDDEGNSTSAVMADVNNDGRQDIYVVNFSGQQNKLWFGNGLGGFTSGDITNDLGSSLGVAHGDINNDGAIDLYTANFSSEQNRLWLGDGSGGFSSDDISGDSFDSSTPIFLDTENDGDLDIYVTTFGGQNVLWRNEFQITTPVPSKKKKGGRVRFVCKDPSASNYNPTRFGRHKDAMCRIAAVEATPVASMCGMAFNSYYQLGDYDPDIMIIQAFLSDHLDLDLAVDGYYGEQTSGAVAVFQKHYASEVLAPWGLVVPTGRWYQSTRKKANAILGCPETAVVLDNGTVLE